MSDLDDQLREAVRDLDQSVGGEQAPVEAAADPVVAESPARRATSEEDPHRGRNLGLLLGALALGAGVLSLVLGSSNDSLKFGRTVEEVLAGKAGDEGRVLTVEGRLVHGSLMKRDEPCEYRFALRSKEGSGGQLDVRYPACIVPDNFRDVAGIDVDVTATGRVQGGVLVADNIATKCPTKYEMEQQKQLGVAAPHAVHPGASAAPLVGDAPPAVPAKGTLGFD